MFCSSMDAPSPAEGGQGPAGPEIRASWIWEAARRPGGSHTQDAGLGSPGPGRHWLVQGLCHSEQWKTGSERGPAPKAIREKSRPAQWAAYQVQKIGRLSKSAPLDYVRSQVPGSLPAKYPVGVPCCLSPGLQCVRCPLTFRWPLQGALSRVQSLPAAAPHTPEELGSQASFLPIS